MAVDRGRLSSRSSSPPFTITPPPREVVTDTGTGVKLTLRGISWAGGKGVALINNDVVGEDDYVAGYRIVKIAKNGVLLKRNQREVFLQLKE